jgi:hypothetical protein
MSVFDSEGLIDFSTGAFNGGVAGAKVSGGNPWVAGGSALALGALSYFGGTSQRSLEKESNALSLKLGEQDLQLGSLNISEARRKRVKNIESDRRKEAFGEMLAQYFQKQGVV